MTQGTRTRVLVVDDEPVLSGTIENYLERSGMEARSCGDGPAALEIVREWAPDCVVLDVGLPGIDGLEVCRRLRTFTDCYVLMLTARVDEVDTLLGLSVGADDYMTKPFSPRELVARIQVLLRRPRPSFAAPAPVLRAGGLVVAPEARKASVDGRDVELTRTEFDLLAALAGQPGTVFTRQQLMTQVWGSQWFGDDHVVDVHIAHLRRKLGDDPASPRFVTTVRGVGYRLGTGR